MRTWPLFFVVLMAVGAIIFTSGRVNAAPGSPAAPSDAAPAQQVSEPTIGLFGTVSAIVVSTSTTSTIVLDGGEVVAIDASTAFSVPDVDDAGLADIAVGDRVAIVAVTNGGTVALSVTAIPGAPVSTIHLLGIVTATGQGTITLTDAGGATTTISVPSGTVANLGDFLTVIAVQEGDILTATEITSIDEIVAKLAEEIETATGETLAVLQQLLEANGDQQLTALVEALEEVEDGDEDSDENQV